MNRTEERLRRAAAETRQLATSGRPTPMPAMKPTTNRGWMVLAGAFAVVLVFGALPLLFEPEPEPPTTETTPLASPSSTPASTTSAPEMSCSAAGFAGSVTPQEIPRQVAATRAAIVDAALACDFDELEGLAGQDLVTGFDGSGAERLRVWESRGEPVIRTLVQILLASPGTIDLENGRTLYVWPSAAVYESWDSVPPEAMDELRDIYTPEELELIGDAGVYMGWRTVVDSEGRWLNFVAGD